MAREGRLAVTVEIDMRETEGMGPQQLADHIVGTVRAKAEEEVAAVPGAQLRTDRAPGLDVKRGEHKLLGLSFWLVWSNWYVWLPEHAEVDEVAAP